MAAKKPAAKKPAKKKAEPTQPTQPTSTPVVVPATSTEARVIRDAFLQQNLDRLTVRVVKEVEWQLNHAPPAARREILKSIVPALFRETQEKSTDEELVELRAAVREQNEQLRALMYHTTQTLPPAVPPVDG